MRLFHFFATISLVYVVILSSQCEKLKNSICPREWKTAVQVNLELPDCSSLPSEPSLCPLSSENKISSEESNLST